MEDVEDVVVRGAGTWAASAGSPGRGGGRVVGDSREQERDRESTGPDYLPVITGGLPERVDGHRNVHHRACAQPRPPWASCQQSGCQHQVQHADHGGAAGIDQADQPTRRARSGQQRPPITSVPAPTVTAARCPAS